VRRGPRIGPPFARAQRQPEQRSPRGQQRGVAREDELAGPVGKCRRQRQIRADSGWLAGRDDDATRAQGFLIST
jgi:hypothetical protein